MSLQINLLSLKHLNFLFQTHLQQKLGNLSGYQTWQKSPVALDEPEQLFNYSF